MARLANFRDALKQDPYDDAQPPEPDKERVGEGSDSSGEHSLASQEPDTEADTAEAEMKPTDKKAPKSTAKRNMTTPSRSSTKAPAKRPSERSAAIPSRQKGTSSPDDEPVEELPAVPLYLQLQRKEARLRQHQVDDLEMLTKQINRRRRRTPEQRITDNTMIRIAVDLLLERSDELSGDDEDELRLSVGLPTVDY